MGGDGTDVRGDDSVERGARLIGGAMGDSRQEREEEGNDSGVTDVDVSSIAHPRQIMI